LTIVLSPGEVDKFILDYESIADFDSKFVENERFAPSHLFKFEVV
jgi:hypothetical protein